MRLRDVTFGPGRLAVSAFFQSLCKAKLISCWLNPLSKTEDERFSKNVNLFLYHVLHPYNQSFFFFPSFFFFYHANKKQQQHAIELQAGYVLCVGSDIVMIEHKSGRACKAVSYIYGTIMSRLPKSYKCTDAVQRDELLPFRLDKAEDVG